MFAVFGETQKGKIMKRQILSGLGIVFSALGLITAGAEARPVTIYIEAEVDSVGDSGNYLEGKINPGDIITGYYTYESTTVDSNPEDPVQGNYWHYSTPAGIYLSVGGFDFQTDPTNVEFQVFIRNNNLSGDDIYGVDSRNNRSLSNGTLVEKLFWQLNDDSGTAFSSDALPLTAPFLSDWQSNILNISGGEKGASFGIWANVTSAVPEPSTILLLGLGVFFIKKRG